MRYGKDGSGRIMRIEDLPRPWLLAAMTGVPMAALLERAERERAARIEQARRHPFSDMYRRAGAADRPALALQGRLIESRSLAS
jgi:hypothetical protein